MKVTNLYAYVGGNPIQFADPLGLAYQLVVGAGATVIGGFAGGGANFNVGVNVDGWKSSIYIQDQGNYGVGAGAFLGVGFNVAVAHADAPETGFDVQKYAEGDVASA